MAHWRAPSQEKDIFLDQVLPESFGISGRENERGGGPWGCPGAEVPTSESLGAWEITLVLPLCPTHSDLTGTKVGHWCFFKSPPPQVILTSSQGWKAENPRDSAEFWGNTAKCPSLVNTIKEPRSNAYNLSPPEHLKEPRQRWERHSLSFPPNWVEDKSQGRYARPQWWEGASGGECLPEEQTFSLRLEEEWNLDKW